eukprot:4128700-Pleurochrysis_carterae.AAC.2
MKPATGLSSTDLAGRDAHRHAGSATTRSSSAARTTVRSTMPCCSRSEKSSSRCRSCRGAAVSAAPETSTQPRWRPSLASSAMPAHPDRDGTHGQAAPGAGASQARPHGARAAASPAQGSQPCTLPAAARARPHPQQSNRQSKDEK